METLRLTPPTVLIIVCMALTTTRLPSSRIMIRSDSEAT